VWTASVVSQSINPPAHPSHCCVKNDEQPAGVQNSHDRKNPRCQFILGQSHFIKTVEDICEAVIGSVPGAKFGLAFCESSGDCLVRIEGNDEALKTLARDNALAIGAGHSFISSYVTVIPSMS